MELHQAVAGNIHRIRKSQRLSMDRAAELAGISVSMWGQVERGSVNPTLAVLGKIASGLHVPLELLIENREEARHSVPGGRRGRAAPLRRQSHPLSPVPL